MTRLILWLLGTIFGCWLSTLGYAAPPSRDNTYVAGNTIQPNENLANENNLYTYLQNGVDTYATSSIPTAALQDSAVTSAKIANGTITQDDLAFTLSVGNVLPAGAVFFMISGACPSWTTNVSATYSNLFVRINATAASQSGSNTHTHTVGSYVGAAHTHSVAGSGWTTGSPSQTLTEIAAGKVAETYERLTSVASGSGGGGAVTGVSGSNDNIPQYVTMIACQVQ